MSAQASRARMSEGHPAVAVHLAPAVPYSAFEPSSPASPQQPQSPAANARRADVSRMTWGYWFVRGMFKLVIRLFMYCNPP